MNGAALLVAVKTLQGLPNLFTMILVFLFIFFLLTDFVLLVKYCILICHDYSVKNAVMFLVKLSVIPIILLGISIVLGILPFEQWGFGLR